MNMRSNSEQIKYTNVDIASDIAAAERDHSKRCIGCCKHHKRCKFKKEFTGVGWYYIFFLNEFEQVSYRLRPPMPTANPHWTKPVLNETCYFSLSPNSNKNKHQYNGERYGCMNQNRQ